MVPLLSEMGSTGEGKLGLGFGNIGWWITRPHGRWCVSYPERVPMPDLQQCAERRAARTAKLAGADSPTDGARKRNPARIPANLPRPAPCAKFASRSLSTMSLLPKRPRLGTAHWTMVLSLLSNSAFSRIPNNHAAVEIFREKTSGYS